MFTFNSIRTKFVGIIVTIGIVSLVFAICYGFYIKGVMQQDAFQERKLFLQSQISEAINAKLMIAASNAVGLANNGTLSKSLIEEDRELGINRLQMLINDYASNADYKGMKVHMYTAELRSFIRSWATDKFGDDISFRPTLKAVKDTRKALSAIELGRDGIGLRGIAPIIEMETMSALWRSCLAQAASQGRWSKKRCTSSHCLEKI